MKKTLMITGASGFIGTNFIEKYKDEFNIIPVCLIKDKPEDLDYKGVDCILHLAALVHQMNGAPEEKYFEVNTELTKRLANKAKEAGVGHFVFYSTVKVYGYDGNLQNPDFVLDEDSPCTPNDPYGKSKYEAEKYLETLQSENFKVGVIRPPMVYGAGVKGNMLSLIKLVDKVSILPFNYDEFKRSIVYIDNLLEITKTMIVEEKRGVIIPEDVKAVSIKEIIEGIGEGLGKRVFLFRFPRFVFNVLIRVKPQVMVRLYGGLQFKNNGLGKIDSKKGLRQMVRWYKG